MAQNEGGLKKWVKAGFRAIGPPLNGSSANKMGQVRGGSTLAIRKGSWRPNRAREKQMGDYGRGRELMGEI